MKNWSRWVNYMLNERCIALRHAYLRPRIEQPVKYREIAGGVHRLKVGQHFDVPAGLYAAARLDRVSVRGLPASSRR